MQCCIGDDFIFVWVLTSSTLRSGGRGEAVSVVLVANFCPSTVSICSGLVQIQVLECLSSIRSVLLSGFVTNMEPQPPRMSKDERRLAWSVHGVGKSHTEIASMLHRSAGCLGHSHRAVPARACVWSDTIVISGPALCRLDPAVQRVVPCRGPDSACTVPAQCLHSACTVPAQCPHSACMVKPTSFCEIVVSGKKRKC